MQDHKINLVTATPVRAQVADDPMDVLRFAIETFPSGPVALVTLVEVRGGAARSLGSNVAVAFDGRFCGYVSGGCVEAAVAAEALDAIAQDADRLVMFGDGSPYFDIVLPCGGGITVAIHVLRSTEPLEDVIAQVTSRQPTGLRYSPQTGTLFSVPPPARARWLEGDFVTAFYPPIRVLISGQSVETEAVAMLAACARYEAIIIQPRTSARDLAAAIDTYTAVALLHHDLDAEADLLEAALGSSAFYLGALGSTRTHRKRSERLLRSGFDRSAIDRIKAPIGMFGPTRDATTLALSVLGDIAAARLMSTS